MSRGALRTGGTEVPAGSFGCETLRRRNLKERRRSREILLWVVYVEVLVASLALANRPLFAQESVVSSSAPLTRAAMADFDPRTRWLLDSEVGSDEGLGYKLPHTAFGVSLEKPIFRRFELQARISDSPDRKAITNDGNTLSTSVGAIAWLHRNFGLYDAMSYSRLWTSQFNKAGWFPRPGVVFRLRLLGIPTRMYLDYVVPTGTIDKKGIESNRLRGVEYFFDARMASVGPLTIRTGLQWNLYHFLDQGDPLCDGTFGKRVTCPRIGHFTATSALTFRFEWLKNASNTMF